MAITVGTDSYVTVAEADTYFGNRPFSTAWIGEDDVKEDALKYATKLMELRNYKGGRYVSTQTLSFPRSGLYIDSVAVDSDTVHQNVKDAQCEIALQVLQTDYSAVDSLSEYSDIKVGPIEVSTKSGGRLASGAKRLPPIAIQLLSFAMASSSELVQG
jgi:hypothetical protein